MKKRLKSNVRNCPKCNSLIKLEPHPWRAGGAVLATCTQCDFEDYTMVNHQPYDFTLLSENEE